MNKPEPCGHCDNCGWVCENHITRPAVGKNNCHCGGAFEPCKMCNADNPPRIIAHAQPTPTVKSEELLNDMDVIQRLKDYIHKHHQGRPDKFADSIGESTLIVLCMMRGNCYLSNNVLKAIGLKKVTYYEKVFSHEQGKLEFMPALQEAIKDKQR